MTKRVMLMWGGGKESMLALCKLKEMSDVEIAGLVTLVDQNHAFTKRHNTRIELIRKQAEKLNLPLMEIALSPMTSMSQYFELLHEWQQEVREVLGNFADQGGTHVAFGYFATEYELENQNVHAVGLECMYPLLGLAEEEVVTEMQARNIKAFVVRTEHISGWQETAADYCGVDWDSGFINAMRGLGRSLTGENGSFNTFCYSSPLFDAPIEFTAQQKVTIDVESFMSDTSTLDVNSDALLQQGLQRHYTEIFLK